MESDAPKIDYKRLGPTGEKISAIGLGTYGISDYKKGEEAFVYAVESGINLIDTAEVYNTEDFVGNVIKRVGRENVFVTTKVAPRNIVTRESTLRSARASLKRMGIGSVDLILIHWPHESMNISDQIRKIESVQKEGLARYIGVSNFSVGQIEEARNSTSSAEVVCDQVKYNLSSREIEGDLIPYCEEKDVSVVAYTPIDKGRSQKNKGLMQVSESTGKTPIQVSLNFLMGRKNVVPIPKTESLEHMKEIVGSMGWTLTREEIELIG